MIEHINDTNAPLPRGHYSQAVRANGLVFISGQLPLIPGLELIVPPELDDQVFQVFENLEAVLQGVGCSLRDLISVQVFIADMANWPKINELYARILGTGPAPARTVISCPQIHYGADIEVSAVALAPVVT